MDEGTEREVGRVDKWVAGCTSSLMSWCNQSEEEMVAPPLTSNGSVSSQASEKGDGRFMGQGGETEVRMGEEGWAENWKDWMDEFPVLLIRNRVSDWSQSCSLANQPEEEVTAQQKSESCILLTSERVVQMRNLTAGQ